jgi:hypothetical protein
VETEVEVQVIGVGIGAGESAVRVELAEAGTQRAAGRGVRLGAPQGLFERSDQGRQVVGDRVPQDITVDDIIPVHE